MFGYSYMFVVQFYYLGMQELIGVLVLDILMFDVVSGQISVMLLVLVNCMWFNVDYVVYLMLYEGQVDLVFVVDVMLLVEICDIESEVIVIQVYVVQCVIVIVVDVVDGDRVLFGKGGSIVVRVDYENLVEGYFYMIWGELMKILG